MESGLRKFLDDRDKAMRELDLDYARNQMGRPTASDDFALMVLHKARYECTSIEPELRHASRAWLAAQGCRRLTGQPLLPEGELPE